MLRCPQCGAENPDDSFFCGSCGAQVRSALGGPAGPVEVGGDVAEAVSSPPPAATLPPPVSAPSLSAGPTPAQLGIVAPPPAAVTPPAAVVPPPVSSAAAAASPNRLDLSTAGGTAQPAGQLPGPGSSAGFSAGADGDVGSPLEAPPQASSGYAPPPGYVPPPGSMQLPPGAAPYNPYQQPYDGNTSGMGAGYPLPPAASGWTFAGFVPWGLFSFFNNNTTWGVIGLALYFFGFYIVYGIYMGIKGREMAWQERRFESLEHYEATMKAWNTWGLVLLCMAVGGLILYFIAVFAFALAVGTTAATSGTTSP